MAKKHSKRYNSAIKVADLTKDYPLKDAVEILTKFPKAKFDETVELFAERHDVDALRAERGADRGRRICGAGGQLKANVTLDLLSHVKACGGCLSCR